jgi:hypothetical protein
MDSALATTENVSQVQLPPPPFPLQVTLLASTTYFIHTISI